MSGSRTCISSERYLGQCRTTFLELEVVAVSVQLRVAHQLLVARKKTRKISGLLQVIAHGGLLRRGKGRVFLPNRLIARLKTQLNADQTIVVYWIG